MAIVKFKNRPFSPFFPSFVDDFFVNDAVPFDSTNGNSVPPTNIEETETEFKLDMAIPGLNKEDINVEVADNRLIVSTEKEESSEEEDKNYTRKEYSYSSFERSFALPENATGDVSAKYEDGVLQVTLPKKKVEVSKSKKIKVA